MPEHPKLLPQLRLPDAVYFVTWRLKNRRDTLVPGERDIVMECLSRYHQERYRLAAIVVMDDHVHVLVQPLPGYELSRALHTWKSYTASTINKRRGVSGALWQKGSHTRIVLSERELWAKAEYIINNPAKRWPGISDYPWAHWFDVF